MHERAVVAYDLIHRARGKDYAAESAIITSHVRRLSPNASSLLDVACGTGGHLVHLASEFPVLAGLDISEPMIERARSRLPDVPLRVGDMRTFDFGRQFDAVTCLFSSIGYLVSVDEIRMAIANMARHVAPGGVVIVEPWIHPAAWKDGTVHADAAQEPGMAVAVSRVSRAWSEGRVSRFEMHYTVATPARVEVFSEQHAMGLYHVEEYIEAFLDAGLRVEHDREGLIGRGLFIGEVARSQSRAPSPS